MEIEKGYKYINFLHDGSWQWEFVYEDIQFLQEDIEKQENQLAEEADKGLTNWNDFLFDEDDQAIEKKLEGFCSARKTIAALNTRKVIHCSDFKFMNAKIDVFFGFESDGLVSIELNFEPKWYETLLPLLKKKYGDPGSPYSELKKNDSYYPYIEFQEKNILLIHKVGLPPKNEVSVSLFYYKEGYLEKKELQGDAGKEKTPNEKVREKTKQLLDSL